MQAGENSLNTEGLSNGAYILEMQSEGTRAKGRFIVNR